MEAEAGGPLLSVGTGQAYSCTVEVIKRTQPPALETGLEIENQTGTREAWIQIPTQTRSLLGDHSLASLSLSQIYLKGSCEY